MHVTPAVNLHVAVNACRHHLMENKFAKQKYVKNSNNLQVTQKNFKKEPKMFPRHVMGTQQKIYNYYIYYKQEILLVKCRR